MPLFDSGEADGFLFFVAPYIEGDTLRDKIDREKQLSVDEALKITEKVASALDYAHEHGVVHRDIKPGNILLSEKGEPTVADFGIALAVAHAGGGRVTETGLSVGTPHYMSPEQATGDRDVDPRTDVYALECVLYEMLVGDPPYGGSTAQAVLAKILTDPAPAPTKIRLSIPPNVDAAIRKALEKLPADRFATAQEFSKALGDAAFRHGEEAGVGVVERRGQWTPVAIAATAVAVVAVGWSLLRPEPPAQLARFSSPFEEGQLPIGAFQFADDGSLVYVGPAELGPGSQLWIRRWADLEATPIRGTEGAITLALSPDGTEVAFAPLPGPIRAIPLAGGNSRTLGQAQTVSDWAADGAVYFGTPGATAIARVPAAGGDTESITERLEGETFHSILRLAAGGTSGLSIPSRHRAGLYH